MVYGWGTMAIVNKDVVFRKEGAVVILSLEPMQGLHFDRLGGQDDCRIDAGHSARSFARSLAGFTSENVCAARGCKTAMPLLKLFCQMV